MKVNGLQPLRIQTAKFLIASRIDLYFWMIEYIECFQNRSAKKINYAAICASPATRCIYERGLQRSCRLLGRANFHVVKAAASLIMLHDRLRWPTLILQVCTLPVFSPVLSLAQGPSRPTSAASNPTLEGGRIFSARCAGCHGLDGRGAERGPDIASRAEIQHLPDKALLSIVREGVAGTGMPAFRSLGTSGIHAVVGHLRTLQGRGPAAALPGNPDNGKALFFGKSGCTQCHMANGEGGFIAADLSNYASTRSAIEIRNAITDPNKNLDPRERTVVVTTADGVTQTGIARNEEQLHFAAPDHGWRVPFLYEGRIAKHRASI